MTTFFIQAPAHITPLRKYHSSGWLTRDEGFLIMSMKLSDFHLHLGPSHTKRRRWSLYPMAEKHPRADPHVAALIKGQRIWRTKRSLVASLEAARREWEEIDIECVVKT